MEVDLKGNKFFVNQNNYESFWNNLKEWEHNELQFLIDQSEKDKIFIDIGAWIGPYTLLAAKLGMKVYSYEPDKIAFDELKKNIELNSFRYRPEIFNFGLSKINSKAYLYSNTNDFGKSESGLINYKNPKNSKKIEIELKNFLQEIEKIKRKNLNNKIKILKIDIEGGEFLFEKHIYNIVNLEKLFCILSYHHMIFNRNKIKKFFYKIRTLFYQIFIQKLYPTKKIYKRSSIFRYK